MSYAPSVKGTRIALFGSTGVLGATYARAFAEEGARLALFDRPGTGVTRQAEELGALGAEMVVTDERSVGSAVAMAADRLGGLDGAIANAAVTSESLKKEGDAFADFEDYPLALWNLALAVNLTGTFLVARELGKVFRHQRAGSLVTVSSTYGLVGPDHRIYEGQPFRSFPAYSASKAGVIGLTKWLATWWGPHGARVNCVVPGGVYNDHSEDFVRAYGNRTPMGRMAKREELVGIMIYLLSDAAKYCTGQVFVVDGGYTAW